MVNQKLSKKQKSILVGCIFSDGYISSSSKLLISDKSNYRFCLLQSIKNEEYVIWLFEQFKNFCSNRGVYHYKRFVDNNFFVGIQEKVSISTLRDPEFTKLREIFYPNNKKTITEKNVKLIDSLALAHIIAGDGHFSKHTKLYQIHTECFSYNENQILLKHLEKKFGLTGYVHERKKIKGKKKSFYIIKFHVESSRKLNRIIKPHLKEFKCFKYKI